MQWGGGGGRGTAGVATATGQGPVAMRWMQWVAHYDRPAMSLQRRMAGGCSITVAAPHSLVELACLPLLAPPQYSPSTRARPRSDLAMGGTDAIVL